MSQSLSEKTTADLMDTETALVTGSSLAESEVDPSKAAERKLSGASSDDSIIDQWRRSIVVSDVPDKNVSRLIMHLEVNKRGGGKIDSHTHDAESRKVLVTFNDTAGNMFNVKLFVSFFSFGNVRLYKSRDMRGISLCSFRDFRTCSTDDD